MSALKGIRVLDVTTVIAAPFAAGLMADFGADVIKVELPGTGDPFRKLGPYHKGQALRWATMGRNKRCITLDLHQKVGKDLFLQLVAKSDLVLENFRTGTLAKWGLDYQTLRKANPKVIVVHVTGYGQTGPYKDKAGFGTPATAFSGMTYITGYPDRPPVSPSFSLTDYISGLYAVMGALLALYHRDALKGPGQEVDISLYEGIFRMLEFLVADFDKNHVVRERKPMLSGTSSPGGTYQTRDGQWVVLVTSTDKTFEYLARAMNREDLLTNPQFSTNAARLENDAEVDTIVRDWIGSHNYKNMKDILDDAGVPVNLIYSIQEIFKDPHYQARENIVEMPHPQLQTIKMPGVVPKMSVTPGEIKWVGPELGAHNEEVYRSLLNLDTEEITRLKEQRVI
ncbi:MAG: CoA transferase [Desulfitobacteriaceae bacterium]|nr:CoA transferase [Desulfitobacteriaceae bacterium]MDI6913902.1 CoA transferase [Desulfitobacteriaceae bacterium]